MAHNQEQLLKEKTTFILELKDSKATVRLPMGIIPGDPSAFKVIGTPFLEEDPIYNHNRSDPRVICVWSGHAALENTQRNTRGRIPFPHRIPVPLKEKKHVKRILGTKDPEVQLLLRTGGEEELIPLPMGCCMGSIFTPEQKFDNALIARYTLKYLAVQIGMHPSKYAYPDY